MAVLAHATSTLIYPFQHDLDRPSPKQTDQRPPQEMEHDQRTDWPDRMRLLETRWEPWWLRKERQGLLERSLDDTFFFLPYVRALLFPETSPLNKDDSSEHPRRTIERVRRRLQGSLAEWAENLGPGGVQRMTLRPDALGFRECTIVPGNGGMSAQTAAIEWIDALLFPQRTGFLLIRISAPSGIDSASFADLLYLSCMVHPPNLEFSLPRWEASVGGETVRFVLRDMCESLVAGMNKHGAAEELSTRCRLTIRQDLAWLADHPGSIRYVFTPEGQTYGTRLRHFTLACLAQLEPGWTTDPLETRIDLQKYFETPGDWLAHELATMTSFADPAFRPRRDELSSTFASVRYRYWENWSLLGVREGVAAVGEYASDWTENKQPAIFDADYLPLYLLTLYQDIRLSVLAGEIQSRTTDPAHELDQANRYLDELLTFRNYYWFVEPTSLPQGIALYTLFQRSLGLPTLFASIRDELVELQSYFNSRVSEQNRKVSEKNQKQLDRIQHWGLRFALASLAISFLSLLVAGISAWADYHTFVTPPDQQFRLPDPPVPAAPLRAPIDPKAVPDSQRLAR